MVRQQQRIKKEPLSKSLTRAICLIFSWHAAPLPKCPAVFSPPVPAGSHGSTFPQAPSLYSHCSLFLARVFHCPSGKHILIKTNTMSAPFTEDSWLLETQRPLPPVCSPSRHRSTCNSSAYRSASPYRLQNPVGRNRVIFIFVCSDLAQYLVRQKSFINVN